MNCEKLHQDIEKLKEQYNSFSSKLKFSIEKAEGKGKIALSEQLRNTLALQDQILESYLPDFFEKNPELLQLNLGNRIECKDAYDRFSDILTITQLSDKSIMIGGLGTLYRATVDENGELILGDHIEYKGSNGVSDFIRCITQLSDDSIIIANPSTFYRARIDKNGKFNLGNLMGLSINSIAQLSDDSIIAGGDRGVLCHAAIGKNGELDLDNTIECRNYDGDLDDVLAITPLPDDSTMIGGRNGILYRAVIEKDEKNSARMNLPFWKNIGAKQRRTSSKPKLSLGNRIECKDANGNPASIHAITSLHDGSIMVGGENGTLCRITINKNGEPIIGNLIKCEGINESGTIFAITPLLDGSIMIGGTDGILCCATIDENDELSICNSIECKDANGDPASITSITQLFNKSIMVGGWDGALYRVTYEQPTLERLKEHLNKVSAKKAV